VHEIGERAVPPKLIDVMEFGEKPAPETSNSLAIGPAVGPAGIERVGVVLVKDVVAVRPVVTSVAVMVLPPTVMFARTVNPQENVPLAVVAAVQPASGPAEPTFTVAVDEIVKPDPETVYASPFGPCEGEADIDGVVTVKLAVPIPPEVKSMPDRVLTPPAAPAGTVNLQVKPPEELVVMVVPEKVAPPEHETGVSAPETELIWTDAPALGVNPVPVTFIDVPRGSWPGETLRPTVEKARVAEALWFAGLPAVALAAMV
jgi:hypothetical protein